MSEASSHTSYRLIQCLQAEHSTTLFQSSHKELLCKSHTMVSVPTFTCKGSAECDIPGETPSCPKALEPHTKTWPSPDRHRSDISYIYHQLYYWRPNHSPVRIIEKSQPQDTCWTLPHPDKGQGWKVMTSEVWLSPNWPLWLCPHISRSPDSGWRNVVVILQRVH